MSEVSKELTVTILVTPKLLREIASELEAGMEKALVGQECPSRYFFGDEIRVRLLANQTAYHNHKAGNKSAWT